ncbi:MAG TPA: MFS transporter [Candidatus Lustribacter sp.]|jgi:MFS family permease|nr:MFS transporter [Candidatus Lustribacter sp.]
METTSTERFRNRDHLAINALWVGVHFQDAALMTILVPALLLVLAPANHTNVLAALSTIAAVATAIVPPLAGALSDRSRRRGGDRRIQTALILTVDTIALLAMAQVSTVIGLTGWVVIATVALMSGSTVYQVLLPEIVPRRFWGTAAGFRGAMTLVGTIIGLALAALLPAREALLVDAAGVALSAATLLFVPASPPYVEEIRSGAQVRDRWDLMVTLVGRAWIVLGMTLLNTYVLYFFHDVLGIRNASFNTGLVAAAAMIGAVASSVAAGVLSDKLDRRLVVCLSGLPMTLAALGFALWPDPRIIFIFAAMFGLGYGGVFSVGWALALDAVPELGDVARDLGVWGTLSNSPMVIAPALGAVLIAHGSTPADGYRWLFATAAGCFLLGSLTVLAVRNPNGKAA